MALSLSTLRWLPVLLVTVGLCAVASVPGSSMPKLHHSFDKIAHGIVYGLLAASYLYGFGSLGRRFPYRIGLATSFICLPYALSEEWYQSFVPGRVADRFDLRADIIGFLTIIALWLIASHMRKKAQ